MFDHDLESQDEIIVSSIHAKKVKSITKNLKIVVNKAGIQKNITIHSSRHTFATLALQKGLNLESVSNVLGHSKVQTTLRYAKITRKDLDNAMDLFN